MAKKETDTAAPVVESASPDELDLGTRTFMHLGRHYSGRVRVGERGQDHGEIEAEGFEDLKKAAARAAKADADRAAASKAIDDREDSRRDQVKKDSAEV